MKNRVYKKHPNCDHVANNVMKNGILIGCHQGLSKKETTYVIKQIESYLKILKFYYQQTS